MHKASGTVNYYGPFRNQKRAQLWADTEGGPADFPSAIATIADLRKP